MFVWFTCAGLTEIVAPGPQGLLMACRAVQASPVRGHAAHRLGRAAGAVWEGLSEQPESRHGTCLACGSRSTQWFVQNARPWETSRHPRRNGRYARRGWGICTECGMGRVEASDVPKLLDLHREILTA